MPDERSRPPQDRPWESGWVPDTTRAPGTRRLWLAGALALATITACVTAVTVTGDRSDEPARRAAEPTTLGHSAPGGLISFATPSKGASASPEGHRGRPSPTPATSAPTGSALAPEPQRKAPEPPESTGSAKPSKRPASPGTSVRSVNYPDRYWRVRDGSVRLEPIGLGAHQREGASFRRVAGLADPSCSSFATADGRYLRHRSFVLVADADDGSSLFRKDATFCSRPAAASGAVMLESVNHPGRFLRHRDFRVRLDPYEPGALYRADSAFRLVAGPG